MPQRMYTPTFSLEGTSRSFHSGDPKPKPSANPTKKQANPPPYSCQSSPLGGAARGALESGNAWGEEAGEGRRAIGGPPLPSVDLPLNQCGRQPQRKERINYGTDTVAGRGWGGPTGRRGMRSDWTIDPFRKGHPNYFLSKAFLYLHSSVQYGSSNPQTISPY